MSSSAVISHYHRFLIFSIKDIKTKFLLCVAGLRSLFVSLWHLCASSELWLNRQVSNQVKLFSCDSMRTDSRLVLHVYVLFWEMLAYRYLTASICQMPPDLTCHLSPSTLEQYRSADASVCLGEGVSSRFLHT